MSRVFKAPVQPSILSHQFTAIENISAGKH